MQKRVIITILLSGIIILCSLGIVSNLSVNSSISHSINQRKQLASIIANHFDHILQTNLSRLYDVSLVGSIDFSDDDWEPELKALSTAYQYSLFTDGIFLTNLQGNVLLSYPPEQIKDWNLKGIDSFEKAIQSKKPVISSISTMEKTQKKVLFVFVPLRDVYGKMVGLVGGEINPTTHILDNIIRSVPASDSTVIELVDKQGFVIVSSDPSRVFACSDRNRVIEKLIEGDQASVLTCHRCHLNEVGEGFDQHQKRTTDILAFAPLKEAPWGVAVREPSKVVFAPSSDLKKKFLALGIIAILSAIILAMGMSKSVVNPIRSLIKATQEIADGKLERPIKVYSGDEVGILSDSFDKMRRKLNASIKEIQKNNVELEKRVQERTVELQKNRERLAALLRKVITAQEEERERIARELHDETSQSLAALGVSLEIAFISLNENKLTQKEIKELENKVSQIIDGINRLIQDLRPPVLNDLGFVSAVKWLLQRHLGGKDIRYRLHSSDFFNEMTLGKEGVVDDKAELLLFRIIQETVINISKHARASHVYVSLTTDNAYVQVLVSDNGIGFNVTETFHNEELGKNIGYGLMGIRERISLLDGQLDIDSSAEIGTKLKILIPLDSLKVKDV